MASKPATSRVARTIARECIGARVRMLSRKLSRLYDEALRPHGIKFSQMNVLTIVALRGPVAPVEVGRELELEKSTLSRNVALLEARGWLDVLPGEGNGRLLRITPAGARLLRAASGAWRAAQGSAEALLGRRTADDLCRAADRLATSP